MKTPNPPKISLIIITKNRPLDLEACFASIVVADTWPDEFILIDSSTDIRTKKLTRSLAKTVSFPVTYIHEPRSGFPLARNRGLAAAKHKWVVFTDDDCVVDPNFFTEIRRVVVANPSAAAIAGQSLSYYKHNTISQVTAFNESLWKARGRRGGRITDLETLDNKNVAYNMMFLTRNNISYDERRSLFEGASDDCDLGMQIQSAGGKAYYAPKMVVRHKDLTTLIAYTRRVIKRSSAHATYESKWHEWRRDHHLGSKSHVRFLPYFISYCKQNRLSILEICLLSIMVFYPATLIRITKLVANLTSHKSQ